MSDTPESHPRHPALPNASAGSGRAAARPAQSPALPGASGTQGSPIWKLLVQSARYRQVALYVMVAVLALAGLSLPQPQSSTFAQLERRAFDHQMRLLREYSPRPVGNDVVLIGIDESTEAVFSEPLSLWHIHYAKVLDAMRIAKPAAVGVDIVLPTQSYNDYLPGSDQALAVSIFRLQQVAKLVYVSGTDAKGAAVQPLAIHTRFLDPAVNFGTDQQMRDRDEIARRFSERELAQSGRVNTFAGQILRLLGRPVEEGYIDYSVGGPIDYMLMQDVIGLLQRGDEATLKSRFGGRIVLFGTFTVDRDRWKLPVNLAVFERHGKEFDLGQPGVLLHAQVIRSHLAHGLLKPAPIWLAAMLCLAAAGGVFLRFSPGRAFIGMVLFPLLLLVVSLLFILKVQFLFPIAAATTTLWLAFLFRAILDAIDSVVERTRLKRSFSGMVSPAVFEDINSGMLDPDAASTAEVCVIFSDIRGFTTLSEAMAPDQVMNVLQRYFDRMVKSVHRFDGTIDKFIGDGMMILFGAPRPTPDPCTDAVQCALDMLESLDALNVEFEREGLPRLEIGIGINFGKVVVGNIGSSERHNYSAIGDAVNVAARIEGQTKELGRRILITESVVNRISDRFNFEPLGERLVKGHSPVKVWGIRATRTARAGADGTVEEPGGHGQSGAAPQAAR
ncbi:MAG: adenylate/guanylate cyclase domain-containing protein [Burkholderiales bacterium]|nr:adenylate/guanylate cyclase domain-containing protein [Burkholderiales bacterium]